ncbi:hypothetical protein L838_4395 [Mycobacterium avium MAV_120709_2344]|nr:hypothetical protein L838_4395 [Mycobacterium avium MAV_120709_2344]
MWGGSDEHRHSRDGSSEHYTSGLIGLIAPSQPGSTKQNNSDPRDSLCNSDSD